MRILLISWYFPPGNDIGALRIGKMASYLDTHGHDVWVLPGERKHHDESLRLPLSAERIIRAPWFDVDRLSPHAIWHSRPAELPSSSPTGNSPAIRERASWKALISDHYMNLLRIPDHQIGWLPYLLRAGKQLLQQHPVDLIYVSGPPFTSFFAARALGRRFRAPWVAEYRDSWSGDIYTDRPKWREPLDTWLENRAISTAAAIVAVSKPWADYYHLRFRKPTVAISNGFDPEDVLGDKKHKIQRDQPVSIVHMGAMYGGVRDPSVLYEAIGRSKLTPNDIHVFYYGPSRAAIYPLAMKFGVADFVTVADPVAHDKALEIERESDVLMLLQSPLDARNVPAKIFEYFAVCRPILGLGLDNGVPANLIRARRAGIYESNPDVVAEQLMRWVKEKREKGFIDNLPTETRAGLSRVDQFSRLEEFLSVLLNQERKNERAHDKAHKSFSMRASGQ